MSPPSADIMNGTEIDTEAPRPTPTKTSKKGVDFRHGIAPRKSADSTAEFELVADRPKNAQTEKITGEEYEPIVQKLVDWLNDNDYMDDLERSLEQALKYKISTFRRWKIVNVKTFLDYVNHMLRWVPMEDSSGKDVYLHLVCFYFVFNQKPIGRLQTAIRPKNYGKMSWLSQWLADYAIAMGEWMDEPESLSAESLKTFWKSPMYNLNNYVEPRGGWKSFNQFFARSFKPGYRTIYGLNDDSVVVSPADCTYLGANRIDAYSTVNIKGLPWSINELLSGSEYASEFKNGLFTHSLLNAFDYHRLHTPVGGQVLESRVIQGQCSLETNVQEAKEIDDDDEFVTSRSVNAPNSPGYQFLQTRGMIVIDSPIGLVAILPMGMAHVSSVIMTAEQGVMLRKGEEIGYFQFGGSDIVVLYQERSRVKLTAVEGIHLSMGFQVGTGKVQP